MRVWICNYLMNFFNGFLVVDYFVIIKLIDFNIFFCGN